MRSSIFIVLLSALAVSGCARIADSRLNPFNWFEGTENVANVDSEGNIRPLTPPGGITRVIDQRALVGSATSMRIDRSPDGAIVRATGQSSGQGHFNVELVPVSVEGSTLTLAFRAQAPETLAAGTQTISAAYLIGNAELSAIRRVRVQAQENALTSSR